MQLSQSMNYVLTSMAKATSASCLPLFFEKDYLFCFRQHPCRSISCYRFLCKTVSSLSVHASRLSFILLKKEIDPQAPCHRYIRSRFIDNIGYFFIILYTKKHSKMISSAICVMLGPLLLNLVFLNTCSASFIDIETPLDKRTTTSLIDGTTYHLVSFLPGEECRLARCDCFTQLTLSIVGHVG